MLHNSEQQKELTMLPLLRLGFRPFFLIGSLFAVLAIVLWVLTLKGALAFQPLNGSLWWHGHEMLFGFASAIVAGFLLTAVQTWTGIRSVKGLSLLALVAVWITARVLLLINPANWMLLTLIIDVAFLPLVAFFVGARVLKVKQYRNVVFIPVLLLMSLMNLFTYLPGLGFEPVWMSRGMYGMTLLVTFLVAFIGGRVIPMFTANGTRTQKVLPIKWLEWSCLVSLVVLFVLMVTGVTRLESKLVAGVCFVAALLHFIRQLRWRPWVTLKVPLVWSLHLTILFIPIGLLLMGMHFLNGLTTLSVAIHSLTVGAIGGMILAMISRVSLGHTGRALQVGWLMSFAFIAIIFSALTRSLAIAIWPQFVIQFWLVSGILWCLAFAGFVWKYLPVLSAPRIDGRTG